VRGNNRVIAIFSRNKDTRKILNFESLNDMYNEVCVEFYPDLVSKEEVIEWAKSIWGERWENKQVERYLKAIDNEESFIIQFEAKDIPNLGKQEVNIESRFVDWDDC